MVVVNGVEKKRCRRSFIGPDVDIMHMTILQPGDLLKSIVIPNTWAGARFYFEKVAERNTWDFALVNIASAMKVDHNAIADIRMALWLLAWAVRLRCTGRSRAASKWRVADLAASGQAGGTR